MEKKIYERPEIKLYDVKCSSIMVGSDGTGAVDNRYIYGDPWDD